MPNARSALDGPRVYRPDAQLRHDYRAVEPGSTEALWEQRHEAANLHDAYHADLRERTARDLAERPDDVARVHRHVAMLIGYRPDRDRVDEALRLLATVPAESAAGDEHTRLVELATAMAANARHNRRDYVATRVNWFISNACPMLCKGCYSPFVADLVGLDEARRVVTVLADHGTEAVMISGGDPFMWPGIGEVVRAADEAGLEVGIDSTFHQPDALDRLAEVVPHVRTVGVPLDGSTEATIRRFRRGAVGEILPRVLAALDDLDRRGTHVRAHTVVHRDNLDDLEAVADLLAEHPSVRQWALYQYWGRRASTVVNATMDVTSQEFAAAVDRATARVPGIEVLAYPAARRSMTNFMITASGLVVTTAEGRAEEFVVGHVLEDDMADLVSSPAVNQGRLITSLVGHGYGD